MSARKIPRHEDLITLKKSNNLMINFQGLNDITATEHPPKNGDILDDTSQTSCSGYDTIQVRETETKPGGAL